MSKSSVRVINSNGQNQVSLQTNDRVHSLDIPPKPEGYGSNANGAELLFLALAACYCNDIYREAARRGITVERVEVEVEGDFEREDAPGTNISYRARVKAQASPEQVLDLMRHTDQVAEIHNTLRQANQVKLLSCEVL